MQGLIFDEEKKYDLWINREGHRLFYKDAEKVKVNGILISFTDKFGQHQVFSASALTQAREVRK